MSLPKDVLLLIFSNLPQEYRLICRHVCKNWAKLVARTPENLYWRTLPELLAHQGDLVALKWSLNCNYSKGLYTFEGVLAENLNIMDWCFSQRSWLEILGFKTPRIILDINILLLNNKGKSLLRTWAKNKGYLVG